MAVAVHHWRPLFRMAIVSPAFATVRPRVLMTRTGESHLLDDIVAEIADEYGSGFVRLCGQPGSGKSTAIAHLAAVFSYNENLNFLDDPTESQIAACPSHRLTIATMPSGGGRNLELTLQPWGIDELIEYLLAVHHDACSSVIERLGSAARYRWLPAVAVIVLERFAADESLTNPVDALIHYIDELLPFPKQRLAAAQFSLAMLQGGSTPITDATAKLTAAKVPSEVKSLLRHEMVQLPVAAERIRTMISNGYFGDLERRLPRKLIKLVGRRVADTPKTIGRLAKLVSSRRAEASHAMAASILLAADPDWQLPTPTKPWTLGGGYFRGAKWPKVNLWRANLAACDLADADLADAKLDNAELLTARFDGARLIRASLTSIRATGVSFRGALLQQANFELATLINADFEGASLGKAQLRRADLTSAKFKSAHLQSADLSGARLSGAIFVDADLTDAGFQDAVLSGIDLRQAVLDGACFDKATMKAIQFEDVRAVRLRLANANLVGAHLTGTSFPGADLSGAILMGAGLADIDWENVSLAGADLRGATFHMGSSRSGLVGSPYACEGSKTGFYTDDYEDLSFKRPEEVRKANLCGADLRGARAEGVDFYLVDLRGAKMDRAVLEQARNTGTILADFE
jgi:uncharacterized protein YjbI with pentapeptide repeats